MTRKHKCNACRVEMEEWLYLCDKCMHAVLSSKYVSLCTSCLSFLYRKDLEIIDICQECLDNGA